MLCLLENSKIQVLFNDLKSDSPVLFTDLISKSFQENP